MVPCRHTCRRVSLYTLLLAHSVPVQMKKLFLVQDGSLRALVIGRSLFRLPLSENNLPAHIQQCSSFSQFKTNVSLYFCLLWATLRHWMLYLIFILLLTSSLDDIVPPPSLSLVLLEVRSCVKVEVAVLGSKSLIAFTVSEDANAPLNSNPALLSLGKSLGVVSFNRGK